MSRSCDPQRPACLRKERLTWPRLPSSDRASSAAPGRSASPAPATTSLCGTGNRRPGGRAILHRGRSRRSRRNGLLDGQSAATVLARISPVTDLATRSTAPPTCRRTRPRTSRSSAPSSPSSTPSPRLRPSWPARPRRILPSAFTEASGRPGALPRRPSDQSALSDPGGRGRAGALDRSGGRRAHRATSCAPPATRRS